jgi:peptidyl-tRNA hydrolase
VRDWGIDDGPFKLVLVCNMDLKMGKGKVRTPRCDSKEVAVQSSTLPGAIQ